MTPAPQSDGQSRGRLKPYVDFCVERVTAIVREIGPRPSASPAEHRAQQYVAGLLAPVTDDVHLEAFSLAPKAFMGFVPISGALLLACVGVYWWWPPLALLCVTGAVVALGVTGASSLLEGGSAPSVGTAAAAWGLAMAVFSPCFLLVMAFSNFRRASPGANDNLTGVMLSVALAKLLHDTGERLEHTEIRLLNTGAEEAGLEVVLSLVRRVDASGLTVSPGVAAGAESEKPQAPGHAGD